MKIIYSCIVIIILLLPIKDNSHTYQIFRNNRSDTLIIKGITTSTPFILNKLIQKYQQIVLMKLKS